MLSCEIPIMIDAIASSDIGMLRIVGDMKALWTLRLM